MFPSRGAILAGIASIWVIAAGCVEVHEPPWPDVVVNYTTSGSTGTCHCDAKAMKGRVFRITRLEIDEPDAFAQTLNLIWENDIRNNTLNVLVVVEESVQGTGVAFDHLKMVLGPAWHLPVLPYVMPAAEGQPGETAVESYCLLEGLTVPMRLDPYHGYQCQLKSTTPASLYFHSGPRNAPLICAPDNQPANNIPIANLTFRTSFNDDCTELADGFLEGCLTLDAADRICMCLGPAGTCPNTPKPGGATFKADDLDGYCHDACGLDWISFGGIIRSFDVSPACLTPEGKPGYLVRGFFDAKAIPGAKYNPVSSSDCSK